MKVQLLERAGSIETSPLRLTERPAPEPGPGELLIRVRACGVCHTDLHLAEGEIPLRRSPLVPGHQVVGIVERLGPPSTSGSQDSRGGGRRLSPGTRVGVAWLQGACGACGFCRSGRENLCETARFTGYDADGGFGELLTAPADFVYRLPEGYGDVEAAPLLCAGIIGYRALRRTEIQPGQRLALFGFGASAHITLQVARGLGCAVDVYTRGPEHRRLALDLGAEWAGEAGEKAPAPADAAILFAPAGRLIPAALGALKPGGVLAIAAIHLDTVPSFDYSLLFGERSIRSVTASTREDGEALLAAAAATPLRIETETFPLRLANQALQRLKAGQIRGAAVLDLGAEGRAA